jgi:hypothetical protein
VTATPSYGFRISGQSQTGPMTTAMQAGDIGGIQKILKERFPGLEFETMGTEMEEVDKPAEASVAATPTTPVVGTAAKEGEETTATLYGDYMAGLPGGVRELVTTDYKGVRGGRMGRGNYSTASIIPGAQVETPAVALLLHLAPEADQLTTHPLTTVIGNNITATITAAMSTMALSVVPQIQPQQPLQPKRSPLLNPKPGLRPRGPRHKSRSRRQSVKPAPAKWHRQLIEVLMCLLVVPLRLQERKLRINGLQNEWNPRVTSVSWQPLAVEEKT